jgi:bacillithiol system protein YtxJ
MKWKPLQTIEQLEQIIENSQKTPCLIFKHSTTCEISAMAKMRLEKQWDFDESQIIPFYLDLLQYRPISNAIAQRFDVHHESPQVLLLEKGECVYDASHLDISVSDLKSFR